jgi:hypothetical protein
VSTRYYVALCGFDNPIVLIYSQSRQTTTGTRASASAPV